MPASAFDNLARIVSPGSSFEHRLAAMRDFAKELEWTPSYEFITGSEDTVARDHLVVEHGLENAAVISFIRAPHRSSEFDREQLRSLLAISYNNLIEWHLFVSGTEVRCINNLNFPEADQSFSFDKSNLSELLSSTLVDQKLFKTPARRAYSWCDDIFIHLVSRWKRLLKADYGPRINNRNISALFNALIFTRACEDHVRSSGKLLSSLDPVPKAENEIDLPRLIEAVLDELGHQGALQQFIDPADLCPFKRMDYSNAYSLLRDFYKPSASPYEFNFAWMSKHALSRIYERYVSILEVSESDPQLSFIDAVPEEKSPAHTGSVYTPQFVAGFFARYLRDNMTPRTFRALRAIDPACGSGIFVRTLLEQRCNPLVPGTSSETIVEAFASTYAVDRDPNAVASTKLSLTLLYLVFTGKIPPSSNVLAQDAIQQIATKKWALGQFGAILANPPYIKLDHLGNEDRKTVQLYLGEDIPGRLDLYLAFVKLCLEICEPNGFVCLVLPQVFLTAKNASFLRKRISKEFDVRCLVDLKEFPVFEGVGTYNILLIVQRRGSETSPVSAQIARVREFVGPALQACLDRRTVATAYYDVFETGQAIFEEDQWVLLSSKDAGLQKRIREFKPLHSYLDIKQGFVTGADDVFIIPKALVPNGEEAIYIDYLPDRSIRRFQLPAKSDQSVFYPFDEAGKQYSERQIQRQFPKTWKYLVEHKNKLAGRKSVQSGDSFWWRPVRPREPKNLLRPKIVCPHLMLSPRFAIDAKGNFGVSHSPFLITRGDSVDISVLRFFCAVLNSSVVQWHIQTHAPKYGHGYNRIEVALLKDIPVPDPSQVPAAQLNEIFGLTTKLSGRNSVQTDAARLDDIICEIYGLLPDQRDAVLGTT